MGNEGCLRNIQYVIMRTYKQQFRIRTLDNQWKRADFARARWQPMTILHRQMCRVRHATQNCTDPNCSWILFMNTPLILQSVEYTFSLECIFQCVIVRMFSVLPRRRRHSHSTQVTALIMRPQSRWGVNRGCPSANRLYNDFKRALGTTSSWAVSV